MMVVSPVIVIKVVDNTSVGVRTRLRDDYAEHEIILNSILTYYWANDLPPVNKFLELFDSVIKRSINEIMPHKTLELKYEVKADNVLEKANEFEINLTDVIADGVGFKIENPKFSLNGFSNKIYDDKTPFNASFERSIETPEIVLKKYMEMKDR